MLFRSVGGDIHYQQVANGNDSGFGSSVPHDKSNNEFLLLPMVSFIAKSHILMLHAVDDSERVPWANPTGKVFLPVPYLLIWHSMTLMGQFLSFLNKDLQFLLVQDKLLKMKVSCLVHIV